MSRVDLLISNDRHHAAMTWPVAAALAGDGGLRIRVLSLCELRGLATPAAEAAPAGVEIHRVLRWRIRSSPSAGPAARPGPPSLARRLARGLTWRLLLAPGLTRLLRRRPRLVVLPNDAAFPYDRISRQLRRLRIPFLLLQEGIRFPLAGRAGEPVYGAGGAAAVAAWGEASGAYFRAAGVEPDRVHLTGSPRFDRPAPPSREATAGRTLLLASNPIDDQGLCTRAEKLALIGRFVAGLGPLFADPGFRLGIKLHGRESREEVAPLLADTPPDRVSIHTDTPLERLFETAGAVVVLASTVGLEALLHGLPLAVLEIPGHGFQYDYVESGAAVGLTWKAPLAPQVESVFQPSEQQRADVEAYLQRQIASRHEATDRVVALILDLLDASR